jgi:hypothetical protein
MRMVHFILLLFTFLLVSGCQSTNEPGPSEAKVPGIGSTFVDEQVDIDHDGNEMPGKQVTTWMIIDTSVMYEGRSCVVFEVNGRSPYYFNYPANGDLAQFMIFERNNKLDTLGWVEIPYGTKQTKEVLLYDTIGPGGTRYRSMIRYSHVADLKLTIAGQELDVVKLNHQWIDMKDNAIVSSPDWFFYYSPKLRMVVKREYPYSSTSTGSRAIMTSFTIK